MDMRVFVVGYPGRIGGADTELWHVLRLWRQHGLQVALIPTWHAPEEWEHRCNRLGVKTYKVPAPNAVAELPSLGESVVVSF